MTDYEGLAETFSEDLKETAETFELGVNSWMDAGGRINPAVWVEDTAIIMHNHTESGFAGQDYEVVNIAQIEDLEDESNYSAESSTWELLENEELGYEDELAAVFADMNDYTDVGRYLNRECITVEGVNDRLRDGFRRSLHRALD